MRSPAVVNLAEKETVKRLLCEQLFSIYTYRIAVLTVYLSLSLLAMSLLATSVVALAVTLSTVFSSRMAHR